MICLRINTFTQLIQRFQFQVRKLWYVESGTRFGLKKNRHLIFTCVALNKKTFIPEWTRTCAVSKRNPIFGSWRPKRECPCFLSWKHTVISTNHFKTASTQPSSASYLSNGLSCRAFSSSSYSKHRPTRGGSRRAFKRTEGDPHNSLSRFDNSKSTSVTSRRVRDDDNVTKNYPFVGDARVLSYRLQKGEINNILWRLQTDHRIIEAANNEGLNEGQFRTILNSFRKTMRKEFRSSTSLQGVVCAVNTNQAHLHDLFPFILKHANELYPMRNCNVENVKRISDLRGPPDLFPEARKLKRKIIYHAGPTNSGKTHAALERFKASESGLYCAPLRLLAAEAYRRTNEAGVHCDLLTGEERLWAISPDEPSSHVACTVEMSSTKHQYECAVIDEIQMMSDPKRGWAWTRALLGLICEEIHLCGEDTAIEMIETIADSCGDELEVLKYDRLGPLTVSPSHLGGNLSHIKPGDCVVAFSQKELFTVRQKIEKTTPYKCAIVYGGLPPATRIEQAAKFNDPNDEHEILVASDAIGMGLNLNIKRIVFKTLKKYDGYSVVQLTPSHTKQIAGRAGRFGSNHPEGEVTTLFGRDFNSLKYLLRRPSERIQAGGLAPTIEQIEMLSHQVPDANLSRLLDVFFKVVQLDGDNYFMCDLEGVKYIADLIDGIPLSIWEQYTMSQVPISQNKTLSASAMVEFARYVSRREKITTPALKEMISWPPSMPKTLKGLQETETLHEICDVYLWLSYRFPEIFIHEEEVRTMQRFIENVIGLAVSSNLKQRRIPKDFRDFTNGSEPGNSKQD